MPGTIRLVEIDSSNWRDVIEVTPRPGQEEFVAPVSRYLLLAHYGGEWHPLGIEHGGKIVGHVMWAVDEADGSVWLGGLVVDGEAQGAGIGRAAVREFIDRFTVDGGCHVALSYDPGNRVARSLYASLGFVETGEMEGEEVVARYRR
jgi:diamine N-acetyltransferase